MTDFILDDGTIIDHGQQWTISLSTGNFVGTITALFPKKELIILEFNLNVLGAMNGHIDANIRETNRRNAQWLENSVWDLHWSTFKAGYEVGTIYRYNTGQPSRRLPPHTFT